ncbi:proline dehydrogenase [Frankia sp. EI5c]|uniref:proline dehydrogenase n=1 Tax=Frankia sp. EI5c TaxID=683316 RepID=UPI000824B94B|nr:proline dehydrogenase [Frankia sp. EI5c]
MLGRLGLGAGPVDALARAALVADVRALASIDILGVPAVDAVEAGTATGSYLALLDLADRAGIAEDLDISLRLALIGQQVARGGAKIAYENAAEICARADTAGATVTLEAGDPTVLDATLTTLTELRRDVPTTGVTLRADLPRTPADCRDLARPACRVRLRPGRHPVGPSAQSLDRAHRDQHDRYAACLGILMAGPGYPMIAAQDSGLIAFATRLAAQIGRGRDSFEFQGARGALRREHRRLAESGYRTRIYLAYGSTPGRAGAARG